VPSDNIKASWIPWRWLTGSQRMTNFAPPFTSVHSVLLSREHRRTFSPVFLNWIILLYFLFYFYFFHSTLLFVLKAIQGCLQHTYKIRLSLRKCKQVRNKYKEDKLQPAGWLVCGMNSVKLYTGDRDGPHVHPWVFQPPTREGDTRGDMTSTSFGGQWSIPKKIKQNDSI